MNKYLHKMTSYLFNVNVELNKKRYGYKFKNKVLYNFENIILKKDQKNNKYYNNIKNGTKIKIITSCKDIIFYKDDKVHRIDKPAIIRSNGTQEWYYEGKKHREDGLPAIIWSNGNKEWYKKGKRHRDHDKPAIIKFMMYNGRFPMKVIEFYKNGRLHRIGKPAVIKFFYNERCEYSKILEYYKNGKLHRDHNKPAIIKINKNNNILYRKKCLAWYKNGKLHREGKPAFIYKVMDQLEAPHKNLSKYYENGEYIK